MFTNGSAKQRNTEIVEGKLSPFEGNKPPSKTADVTRHFEINQTDIVTWVVDRYPYSEAKTPVIYGNVSDAWQANTTLHMPSNSTVDIVMSVANGSMDTVCISWLLRIVEICQYLIKADISPDGSPNASSRPQVLGTGLRDWEFPVSIRH